MITMKYQDALATIEIGTTVDVEDEFVVIGTKGRVTIPGDWWNTGYFEAKIDDSKGLKRYCLTSKAMASVTFAGAAYYDQ